MLHTVIVNHVNEGAVLILGGMAGDPAGMSGLIMSDSPIAIKITQMAQGQRKDYQHDPYQKTRNRKYQPRNSQAVAFVTFGMTVDLRKTDQRKNQTQHAEQKFETTRKG